MNFSLVPTLSLAALLLTAAPALAEARTYTLDSFDRASFASSVEATIAIGDTQSVVAEATDPAVLDDLRIEVVGGELRAWLDDDLWDFLSFRNNELRVVITVPALQAIRASSSSKVDASGLDAGSFAVDADSSAQVRLANVEIGKVMLNADSSSTIVIDGSCDTADVNTSSSATIEAAALQCDVVTVEASSSSTSRVFASDSAKVQANSSATVELSGRPAGLHSEVNSSASLNLLN
jgi:hypothetical protein